MPSQMNAPCGMKAPSGYFWPERQGGCASAGQLEGHHGKGAARAGVGALEWARIRGMLHKTMQDGDVMDHESVRFWLARPAEDEKFQAGNGHQARAGAPGAFNGRLPGRKFPARNGGSGGQARAGRSRTRGRFCGGPGRGVPAARHAVTGYPRAGRDAAGALRKWQLRSVNVVRRRRSGDVTADGPYRAPSGTPDGLMGHRHARPLPQAWSAGAVTRPVCPVPCAEMTSSATGGDFGLGGTAVCGDGGGACALVAALVVTVHKSCRLVP